MLVRIIKPIASLPEGPTIIEQAVAYVQDGVQVIDYAAEATPVEDGTETVLVDTNEGKKPLDVPVYRDPTDAELLARNPDAIYIAKMEGAQAVELKSPEAFVKVHDFSGWQDAVKQGDSK